jgi:hypothetical protein
MPVIRLTSFFRDDDGHGWSETHDKDAGGDTVNLTPYVLSYDALMKTFRVPLLAGDGFYIGCRASYRTPGGKIAAAPKIEDQPIPGTQKIGNELIQMNDAALAVKVRMSNAASTASSDIYLRGVWDGVVQAGILHLGGDAVGTAFKQLLDAYQNALIQNAYGWAGISAAATPRGNVTNYVQTTGKTVKFTVAVTNGAPMPPEKSKVLVNFARINNSNSILNRGLVCTVTSPTELVTIKQIGVTDFTNDGTFIIPTKSIIPYDHVAYRSVSRRKTGRPFGVGRGRLPVRILH